jgi:hypothetical protein
MIGYRLFGYPVASERAFPGAWNGGPADPEATVLTDRDLPTWPDTVDGGWAGASDGRTLTVERSSSGEHRFNIDGVTRFHLSVDLRRLAAPSLASTDDLRWWRVLLDSVLFTVGLLRGKDALHAGAVATPSGVVAVVAGSGGGKSTLLSELLRQGHGLVTDDILFLQCTGAEVIAWPGPPLLTLPGPGVPGPPADGIGQVIGEIGAEVWLSVPVVADSLPLRRIVLLDRRPGQEPRTRAVDRSLVPLMTHFLNFPRAPDRELGRFSLAARLAETVELVALEGSLDTTPQELAALALQGLY